MVPASQKLLLVHLDDNPDDLLFFQHAVISTATPFHVRPFLTPQKAMAYIEAPRDGDATPALALFLCDYDLGAVKGHELVAAIRANPACAALPVLIYSGSCEDPAIALSYSAGANCFLRKPSSIKGLENLVKRLYECVADGCDWTALADLQEYRGSPADHCNSP